MVLLVSMFEYSSMGSNFDQTVMQLRCDIFDNIQWIPVLYQVLNKQVPVQVPVLNLQVSVPVHNLQVPVPVQVLCTNYRHSVTLQLHKVKVVVSFIFKKRTVRTNKLQTQSVVKHHQSDLLVSTPYQTWIQDLLIQNQDRDQDLLIQDQEKDSAVSRPRPRLWCPRPRLRLKTYKTNTGSPWLGWTVTNKKTEKVTASRKSTIPVVAHSKQQNIISCLTTVLFWPLLLNIAVYQTLVRTHYISKVRCFIDS